METTRHATLQESARALSLRVLLFAGAFVGLLALLGVTLTLRGLDVQRTMAGDKIDAVGSSTTTFVAQLIYPYLQFEQTDDVLRLVSDARGATRNALYAAVIGLDGTVLAATPADYRPAKETLPSLKHGAPITIGFRDATARQFIAAVEPKTEATKHVFVLGIDVAPTERELAELRLASLLALGAVLVLGLVVIGLMVRWIQGSVQGTRHAADVIGGTARDLSAAASEIFAVAKQTEAKYLDEASAVDETRRTMASLLDAATEIARTANEVLVAAEKSNDATRSISQRIATLNTQSLRITEISDTIQAIADKSDILALNASLEGAKAGEVGRGFVLVGGEMRRLAEMVLGAVRQIKQLANEIRQLSQAAVLAAEQGQNVAQQTTDAARRITMITGQQRSGTEQVSRSMDDLQEYTQQGLSGAKQGRTTADDLVRTAATLAGLLEAGERPGAGDSAGPSTEPKTS